MQCVSEHGNIQVVVELDEGMRQGVVSLPHGYGIRYRDGEPIGPQLNRLTSTEHCDPLSKTPYHICTCSIRTVRCLSELTILHHIIPNFHFYDLKWCDVNTTKIRKTLYIFMSRLKELSI